jgi:hypothetical protein
MQIVLIIEIYCSFSLEAPPHGRRHKSKDEVNVVLARARMVIGQEATSLLPKKNFRMQNAQICSVHLFLRILKVISTSLSTNISDLRVLQKGKRVMRNSQRQINSRFFFIHGDGIKLRGISQIHDLREVVYITDLVHQWKIEDR